MGSSYVDDGLAAAVGKDAAAAVAAAGFSVYDLDVSDEDGSVLAVLELDGARIASGAALYTWDGGFSLQVLDDGEPERSQARYGLSGQEAEQLVDGLRESASRLKSELSALGLGVSRADG